MTLIVWKFSIYLSKSPQIKRTEMPINQKKGVCSSKASWLVSLSLNRIHMREGAHVNRKILADSGWMDGGEMRNSSRVKIC